MESSYLRLAPASDYPHKSRILKWNLYWQASDSPLLLDPEEFDLRAVQRITEENRFLDGKTFLSASTLSKTVRKTYAQPLSALSFIPPFSANTLHFIGITNEIWCNLQIGRWDWSVHRRYCKVHIWPWKCIQTQLSRSCKRPKEPSTEILMRNGSF